MAKHIPLRTLMALTFGLVFIPEGHIAMPQVAFYLRFTNSTYTWEPADKYILALTVAALAISLTSWVWKRLRLSLAAVPAYLLSTALAFRTWASPEDLLTTLLTGLPFVGTVIAACVIAFRAPPRRTGSA